MLDSILNECKAEGTEQWTWRQPSPLWNRSQGAVEQHNLVSIEAKLQVGLVLYQWSWVKAH